MILVVYVLFNKDITYMLYTITLYLIPYTIVFVLKALYYKGRPFVIVQQVQGCECDPGMPSGHTATAVVAFTVLYKAISHHLVAKLKDSKTQVRGCLIYSFVWIVFFIAASRLTLGAHSVSQIVIAVYIALAIMWCLDFMTSSKFIVRIKHNLNRICVGLIIGLPLFNLIMLGVIYRFMDNVKEWN